MHGRQIFLVKRGRLLTPPIDAGILEGITRNAVIELAREAGIEVAEPPLTRHDVYIADECFLTGTAAEVVPVVQVDGRVDRRRQARADDARADRALSRAWFAGVGQSAPTSTARGRRLASVRAARNSSFSTFSKLASCCWASSMRVRSSRDSRQVNMWAARSTVLFVAADRAADFDGHDAVLGQRGVERQSRARRRRAVEHRRQLGVAVGERAVAVERRLVVRRERGHAVGPLAGWPASGCRWSRRMFPRTPAWLRISAAGPFARRPSRRASP